MPKQFLTILRDNVEFVAKHRSNNQNDDALIPMQYANRTQAEKKAAKLGPEWDVYQRGRPFYVGRKPQGTPSQEIARNYIERAASERSEGGTCDIDTRVPSVFIRLCDGSEFYFQESHADEILDTAKQTMRDTGLDGLLSIEDFLLATS